MLTLSHLTRHEGRIAVVANVGEDAVDAERAIGDARVRRTVKSRGLAAPMQVASSRTG